MAADKTHRGHAIIEQVHADLKNSALAHLPSGKFTANAAWLVLAVMAFNLTRAAATLAGPAMGKATTATIRRKVIVHAAARRGPGKTRGPPSSPACAHHHQRSRRPDHPAPQGPKKNQWNTTDSEVAGTATPSHTINRSSQTRQRHRAHRWIEA